MDIRSLKDIDFDTVFHAFEQAFADYEIRFEKEEVRAMLKRRGFNPGLSFAAFDDDHIVAFTLNGTGEYGGIPTAYDTGTGTLAGYRGQGIAKKIFEYSIPYLRQAGIRQYLLEVIHDNEKAVSVYRKLGFDTTRELDCFRQSIDQITNMRHEAAGVDIEIARMDIKDVVTASGFCDFSPSWQNGVESLTRAGDDLICLGAYISGRFVGYCVLDPLTGDISQIAVDRDHRRKGIATMLLGEAIGLMRTDRIKVLNVSSADEAMKAFLIGKNIAPAGKQFEMILPI